MLRALADPVFCRPVARLIFVLFPGQGVGVMRGPALFSWCFLRLLATCRETSSGPVAGLPAVPVGAVERGGELSSTLDTSNLCCRVCMWALLWWCGWRGNQTLGWETLGPALGVVKVWGSGCGGWCFGVALVGRPPGFLCLFSFWGLGPGRASRGPMTWETSVVLSYVRCPGRCPAFYFIFMTSLF